MNVSVYMFTEDNYVMQPWTCNGHGRKEPFPDMSQVHISKANKCQHLDIWLYSSHSMTSRQDNYNNCSTIIGQ